MAKSGGPKRNKTQKATDKKKAAKLREQGKTLREISGQLGVSHQQVWQDLKSIENELLEEAKESLQAQREKVLAKLRNVQIEAFSAWKQSLQDKERYTEKMTQNGAETSLMREGQSGNAQHLSNLMKSITEEAKLLGLYLPEQQDMNGDNHIVIKLPDNGRRSYTDD